MGQSFQKPKQYKTINSSLLLGIKRVEGGEKWVKSNLEEWMVLPGTLARYSDEQ